MFRLILVLATMVSTLGIQQCSEDSSFTEEDEDVRLDPGFREDGDYSNFTRHDPSEDNITDHRVAVHVQLVDHDKLSRDPMKIADYLLKGFKNKKKDKTMVYQNVQQDIEVEKWTMQRAMEVMRERHCPVNHTDYITVNNTFCTLFKMDDIDKKPKKERIRLVKELRDVIKVLRQQWLTTTAKPKETLID
uniref:Uncharacterized protein n=1 Tax=Clastoptera arizonana TaxID=38151 RepID=A0A1B6E2B2_9HEMI